MTDTHVTSWASVPVNRVSEPATLRAGPVLIAAGEDNSAAVLRAGAFIAEGLQREASVVFALDPMQQLGIGRHRPIDRLLGTETVLRTAWRVDCPVFAVPRTFAVRPSVIVVGVDFSEAGRQAAACTLPLIAPNATVHLVHVWQPSGLVDEAHVARDERYREALPGLFRQLIDTLALPLAVTVKHEAREGRPADRLLDFAEAHHADLIVVGRHGQGLIERLWVGSVATRVLRGAACAVLVVPQPALHARGMVTVSYPPGQWTAQLEAFSRRNAGRVTSLEMSDAARVPFSREQGYVLFGTSYREGQNEVEIILGEANGRRRHLTSVIPNASSLIVVRDDAGADHALRIDHGTSQTRLTLVHANHAADSTRASVSASHRR